MRLVFLLQSTALFVLRFPFSTSMINHRHASAAKTSFEVAVATSLLFKLALEIRIMIYELLLVQEDSMFIPSDTFARNKNKRTGTVPYQCRFSGLIFLVKDGFLAHRKKHGEGCGWIDGATGHSLPGVSISLLKTCRLIRVEASHILYSRNSFYFSSPATASKFRMSTDCAQAGAVHELGIIFGGSYYDMARPWLTYLFKFRYSLDFPHLRRMTIYFGTFMGFQDGKLLRAMSEKLGGRCHGLECVVFVMVPDDKILDYFEPLVDRKDDPENGKMAVQRHVWANTRGYIWKNALLWWGCPGEALPPKYERILLQN